MDTPAGRKHENIEKVQDAAANITLSFSTKVQLAGSDNIHTSRGMVLLNTGEAQFSRFCNSENTKPDYYLRQLPTQQNQHYALKVSLPSLS